jgi:hypothetical protein
LAPPVYWLTNCDNVQLLSQATDNEKPDYDQLIAIKAANFGAQPFGTEYVPIKVTPEKGSSKKRHRSDVCTTGLSPFLIFNGRAGDVLSKYLDSAGERLVIDSPWEDYFGFHLISEIENAVDLAHSEYKMYGDHAVVRRAAIRSQTVSRHAIFTVKEQPSNVYVSEEFRLVFEGEKLRGAKFLPVRVV